MNKIYTLLIAICLAAPTLQASDSNFKNTYLKIAGISAATWLICNNVRLELYKHKLRKERAKLIENGPQILKNAEKPLTTAIESNLGYPINHSGCQPFKDFILDAYKNVANTTHANRWQQRLCQTNSKYVDNYHSNLQDTKTLEAFITFHQNAMKALGVSSPRIT